MFRLIGVLVVLTVSAAARSQSRPSDLPASQHAGRPASRPAPRAASLTWDGVTTSAPSGDETWVLLSSGFMGFPGLSAGPAPAIGAAVQDWLRAHPQAEVRMVKRSIAEVFPFTYVWLVDGRDNCAVELVRWGLLDSHSVLIRFGEEDDLAVARATYEDFAKQVRAAEIEAIRAQRGRWADGSLEADAHVTLARYFEDEGNLRAAIEEYERVEAVYQRAPEGDAPIGWPQLADRVAACQMKLGEYDQALAVLERGLHAAREHEPGPVAFLEGRRADVLAARDGAPAGARHLAELCRENPNRLDYLQVLGRFHLVQKSYPEGLRLVEPSLAAWLERRGSKLGATTALTRAEVAQLPQADLLELSTLLDTLAALAREAGELDAAETHARSALAIAEHQMATNPFEAWPAEMVDAGGVAPRLQLARNAMQRGNFEEAHGHLDQAKRLVDRLGSRRFDRMQVRAAYTELQRRFPGKTLRIPATAPASRPAPRHSEPAAAPATQPARPASTLAQIADAELLALATERKRPTLETPHISRFAALDELCRRAESDRLDSATWNDAVGYAMALQADPQADWRSGWGCLVELAWDQGRLTADQIKAYAGYSICLSKLRAVTKTPPATGKGPVTLKLTCEFASRSAECPYPLDPHLFRLGGQISLETARVDDREVGVPDSERGIQLDVGGPPLDTQVTLALPSWVQSGRHSVIGIWRISIWRRGLGGSWSAKQPPLSERLVTRRADFEYRN